MNEKRISIFLKENPGKKFPWFRSLSKNEEQELYTKFCEVLGLPPSITWKELILEVDRRQIYVGNCNFEQPGDGQRIFGAKLAANKETKVYVWSLMFDSLDEMYLAEIIDIFGYIWYESAEDVYVIDTSLQWLISVKHYCAVSELQLRV